MSDRAYERADEVQQLLTETGRHRSAAPVDLLIAATAERAGLIVLCDDRDFQTVASVTGQPVKLVADFSMRSLLSRAAGRPVAAVLLQIEGVTDHSPRGPAHGAK